MTYPLAWLGSASAIAGAVLVAVNLGADVVVAGYALFLFSSLVWSGLALRRRDWPLLSMQATFAAINVLGLLRWGMA